VTGITSTISVNLVYTKKLFDEFNFHPRRPHRLGTCL
jgi:hypothetical protein